MNGLPPHIAQVICGHKSIDTTMGYKAVYPAETIEAHRAFIARRRAPDRPGEEYRTPTDEEWDAFLAHFEKRKVSVGTCAEHSARPAFTSTHVSDVRSCGRTRPNEPRLEEIRDNSRPASSKPNVEGWLGEVEGLQVSLHRRQRQTRPDRRHTPLQDHCSPAWHAVVRIHLGKVFDP